MAYSEELADRIRKVLSKHEGVTERKMFGGMCFMLHGNMCCGVMQDHLIVRLDPNGAEKALEKPHTRPMDFTGRPMKSMVYVDADGIASQPSLREWLALSVRHAQSLPPK